MRVTAAAVTLATTTGISAAVSKPSSSFSATKNVPAMGAPNAAESPADTAQQLQAFLGVLNEHRQQLEQQLDDIQVTLAEIAQHEDRCRTLLAQAGRARKPARV